MPKTLSVKDIRAREILDSRGNPTVSVRVTLNDGTVAAASVPSGASTGIHEVLELRDGDRKRYGGKGVLRAVRNVNGPIAKALKGMDPRKQRQIDRKMIELDGTENKSRLGANAIIGVSMAVCRAAAVAQGKPLYAWIRQAYGLKLKGWRMPFATMNLLNGGAHAGFAIDFQETMVVPLQKRMSERVRAGSEVFHALARILGKMGFATTVGDEGGYAPKLGSNEKAMRLIVQAIKDAGYRPGKDVALGADVAASEFYSADDGIYDLKCEGKRLTGPQMVRLLGTWLNKYPIVFLEDGLAEDDWKGWEMMTDRLGKKTVLVGDDLFVTNVKRLQRGIDSGVANAILIKVNQIGTLSETIDAIMMAKDNGYKTAISHRSGETADTFIADLAVAVNSEFIKTGSVSRSERLEKYNRLMEIEGEITK
ncbi:phosphopyruvate hydratase [Candidatus Uhrbacteria bacterium]|nr:phosphopyruvate hydratase [Candidatus Uhrbacteria bacterium]